MPGHPPASSGIGAQGSLCGCRVESCAAPVVGADPAALPSRRCEVLFLQLQPFCGCCSPGPSLATFLNNVLGASLSFGTAVVVWSQLVVQGGEGRLGRPLSVRTGGAAGFCPQRAGDGLFRALWPWVLAQLFCSALVGKSRQRQQQVHRCGWVPIKLYLQTQAAAGPDLASGCFCPLLSRAWDCMRGLFPQARAAAPMPKSECL